MASQQAKNKTRKKQPANNLMMLLFCGEVVLKAKPGARVPGTNTVSLLFPCKPCCCATAARPTNNTNTNTNTNIPFCFFFNRTTTTTNRFLENLPKKERPFVVLFLSSAIKPAHIALLCVSCVCLRLMFCFGLCGFVSFCGSFFFCFTHINSIAAHQANDQKGKKIRHRHGCMGTAAGYGTRCL